MHAHWEMATHSQVVSAPAPYTPLSDFLVYNAKTGALIQGPIPGQLQMINNNSEIVITTPTRVLSGTQESIWRMKRIVSFSLGRNRFGHSEAQVVCASPGECLACVGVELRESNPHAIFWRRRCNCVGYRSGRVKSVSRVDRVLIE